MTSLVFSHDGERLLAGAGDTVTSCSLTATPKVEDSLQPLFSARFVSADPESLVVAAITSNNGVQVGVGGVERREWQPAWKENACLLTAGGRVGKAADMRYASDLTLFIHPFLYNEDMLCHFSSLVLNSGYL